MIVEYYIKNMEDIQNTLCDLLDRIIQVMMECKIET